MTARSANAHEDTFTERLGGARVRSAAASLGAHIHGFDLAAPRSRAVEHALRDTLDHFGVLFFHNQQLGPEALVDAARVFGPIARYPFAEGLAGHPDVVRVAKPPGAVTNFGGVWHSDTAYLDEPPGATLLSARVLPATGGDTLFASAVQALGALSPDMQAFLRPLRALNTSAKADAAVGRASGGIVARDVREALHPVVRRHPRSGALALYVNRGHTSHFEGCTVDESRGLLEFLFRHVESPEFGYRFKWQPGDVVVWDNRLVQHFAVNDYGDAPRELWRVTTAGSRPLPADG